MKTLTEATILRNTANDSLIKIIYEAVENDDVDTVKALSESITAIDPKYVVLTEAAIDMGEMRKLVGKIESANSEKEIEESAEKIKSKLKSFTSRWFKYSHNQKGDVRRAWTRVIVRSLATVGAYGVTVAGLAKQTGATNMLALNNARKLTLVGLLLQFLALCVSLVDNKILVKYNEKTLDATLASVNDDIDTLKKALDEHKGNLDTKVIIAVEKTLERYERFRDAVENEIKVRDRKQNK